MLQIAGLVIAPVAFIFVLYALYMYKKRTYQILRREKVRSQMSDSPADFGNVFRGACMHYSWVLANTSDRRRRVLSSAGFLCIVTNLDRIRVALGNIANFSDRQGVYILVHF